MAEKPKHRQIYRVCVGSCVVQFKQVPVTIFFWMLVTTTTVFGILTDN